MSRIKEIREKNNLSQSQLAEKMCISIRTLQAYEQNQRDLSIAKFDVVLKACVALNCTLKEMFEDDENISDLIKEYEKEQQ